VVYGGAQPKKRFTSVFKLQIKREKAQQVLLNCQTVSLLYKMDLNIKPIKCRICSTDSGPATVGVLPPCTTLSTAQAAFAANSRKLHTCLLVQLP